jgi:GTP cyclohydrolase FolE2
MIAETAIPLPTYRRRAEPFPTLFGAPAHAVVTAMNEAGDDVASQAPRVAIGLAHVGATRTGVPLRLADPFGSAGLVTSSCRITIDCHVPPDRRGLHMSRLGDALARSVLSTYPDVATYARELAESVARVEYGAPVSVRVRASIPYLEEIG